MTGEPSKTELALRLLNEGQGCLLTGQTARGMELLEKAKVILEKLVDGK